MTASENIILSMDASGIKIKEKKKKAIELMESVGLKASYADRRVLRLSGGEQQRVCIARAIVNEPKLLICDEPTGNLDPKISKEIVKLINNLMAGIHTQAVAEALSIADAAGLDHEIVYRIVNVSTGQSGIFTRNYKNFIAQDEYYEGAFTTALLLKDLKLANHVSNSFEGKLPLGEELVNYLESNIEEYADKDISSAYLMLTEEKVKLGK